MQAFNNEETFLRCRNSNSSINDLTVGNNEAIATILIITRVIRQQARSYDIDINSLAYEFAPVTSSIHIHVIFENITNKSIWRSNKKKIICSISDDSICHFIYWSTNDPSKYNVENLFPN